MSVDVLHSSKWVKHPEFKKIKHFLFQLGSEAEVVNRIKLVKATKENEDISTSLAATVIKLAKELRSQLILLGNFSSDQNYLLPGLLP